MNYSSFDNLSGVRGIAAAAVLLAHVVAVHFLRFGVDTMLHQISSVASEYAVIIFFILSGYLISHTLEMNIERNGKLRLDTYIAARIARLYPPFLFAIGVSLVIFLLMEVFSLPGRDGSMLLSSDIYSVREVINLSTDEIIKAMLMLQGMLEINGPLWSLYIEAKIYVLFAFTLAVLTRGRSIFCKLVLILVLYYVAKAGVELNPGFARYASIWLIGALAYYVWNKRSVRCNRILLCSALIILAEVFNILENGASLKMVALDILVAAIVSWLLFKVRIQVPSAQHLADCSYSLYVTHFPVLLLAQSLLISTESTSIGAAVGTAVLSVSAAIGVALIGGIVETKKLVLQNQLLKTLYSLEDKFRSYFL